MVKVLVVYTGIPFDLTPAVYSRTVAMMVSNCFILLGQTNGTEVLLLQFREFTLGDLT